MPEKVLQFCRSNELVETFWIDYWNLDSIVGVAMNIHIYLSLSVYTWNLNLVPFFSNLFIIFWEDAPSKKL